MNPYKTFSEVLFTCVDGPKTDVAQTFLDGFNEPSNSSKRDAFGSPIKQYFVKEIDGPIPFPYMNKAERSARVPHRIVFWEPRIRPHTTVLTGIYADGLNHSVFRLSEDRPYAWVNVRMYSSPVYPGCFLDYYADRRKTERRLLATTDERGWDFAQKGPVQPFENTEYYSRRLIKDRLNREIITEYLEKLGYQVMDDNFWEPNGPPILLWQERPNPPPWAAETPVPHPSQQIAPPARSW
ncbi:MAG TPA: hypothetical protein VFE47_06405 [Tepidisphaeraceae bacterium]|jgi:hypothetical protein|nr:hypothetical protein [Tepidisphaeraceae bacterium]